MIPRDSALPQGSVTGSSAGAATLPRTLSAVDLILLGVGTVIGSGIFLVPSLVIRQTGGALGVATLVWIVAGLLSLLGALTYAELGAMKPEAGGLYVYIRDAFGPLVAFLYGWGLFFVIGSGSVATLMVAFTAYLREFYPLDAVTARIVIIALIALLAIVNARGARTSADMQNWMTVVKACAIIALSVAFIARGDGFRATSGEWWPSSMDWTILSGAGAASVRVLWAFEGWQYVTFSAGESADPQRTFPGALAWGTAAIVGIYLLANAGYLAALGPGGMRDAQRVGSDSATATLGPWAAKTITVAILVAIFSAANGLTLTAPRVYFAMARDGLFFRRLALIHPRFRTPAFAIVTSSAWAAILALSGTFEQLLTYVVFSAWIFYALGGAAIFYYRRAEPGAARPFRVPAYPFTPMVFVVSAFAVVINTLMTQPRRAAVGMVILLVGTPAYAIWRKNLRRAVHVRMA